MRTTRQGVEFEASIHVWIISIRTSVGVPLTDILDKTERESKEILNTKIDKYSQIIRHSMSLNTDNKYFTKGLGT